MATTVEVGKNAELLWNDLDFTFADDRANATFGELEAISYYIKCEETLLISSTDKRNYIKRLLDLLPILDKVGYNYKKFMGESVAFNSTYTDIIKFLLRNNESIKLSEFSSHNFFKPLNTYFSIVGKYNRNIIKGNNDLLLVNDNVKYNESFKLSESLHIESTANRSPMKCLMSYFGISDKKNNSSTKAYNDNLNFNEAIRRDMSHVMKEELITNDSILSNIKRLLDEGFNITDVVDKKLATELKESLSIQDAFYRNILYNLKLEESLGTISDILAKRYKITTSDAIYLIDSYIKACESVLSDLAFYDKEITLDEFKKMDVPVGFGEFKEFIAGDHYYKDALFKTTLDSQAVDVKPVLAEWKLNIDVPDVTEKTVTEVPAQENYRIDFTRKFYEIPELTVTIRGNSNLSVYDLQIDATGFSLTLKNSSGEISSGLIYWRAEGY